MITRPRLTPFPGLAAAAIVLLPGSAIGNTNNNAKIAAHLQAIPGGKSPPPVCDQAQLMPCNVGDSTLSVHGNVGVGYRLYLLVLDGNPEAGVAGAAFGISYGNNLRVSNWILCADLDFPGGSSGIVFPDSGSGNLITWVECQDTPAEGDSTGEVTAVLGAVYVYAYGADVFDITQRTYASQPDLQVADCNAQSSDLPWPGQAGSVGFGSSEGSDPCQEQEEAEGNSNGGGVPAVWSETVSGSFELDYQVLDSLLAYAPDQNSLQAADNSTVIELPMPSGTYELVSVQASPIMSPSLALQHPNVTSYVVRGVTNAWLSGRICLASGAFHGTLFAGSSVVLITRLASNPGEYASYYKADVAGAVRCLVQETLHDNPGVMSVSSGESPTVGDTLYSYDLAVHATGEYTAFFGGNSDSAETEMLLAVSAVNAIFERDACIHFNLVHALAYPDPNTDPYSPFSGRDSWFDQNQAAIDDSTEADTVYYDIGHLFSAGPTDSSGRATQPSACIDSLKAHGWSVYPNPTSSVFISYVAHEIGHQLNASHTMAILVDTTHAVTCPVENGEARGVEPGSGSTIMSYAGLFPDSCNVEPTDDGYFHGWNIEQLVAYRNQTCAGTLATMNGPPSLEALLDYTIPRATPFKLRAVGHDSDGDSLTYCWQQIDRGTFNTWPEKGPLFRAWPPSESPSRTLPQFSEILAGPPTYILDGFELLPEIDRDMTFRVTVRDNVPGNGGVAWDDMLLEVRGSPFGITFPNGGDTLVAGDSTTITWDTGDIDSTGTTLVDLWLVLDDDESKQYPLRKNISNDGSFKVAVPNVSSTNARFALRAVDNVCFDVSDSNFTILGTATSVGLGQPAPSRLGLRIYPNPSSTSATILLMVPASRADQLARVDVLDVAGRMVRNLAEGNVPEGEHRFSWDGRDDSGRRVSTGIYFVRARIEHGPQMAQKILLME